MPSFAYTARDNAGRSFNGTLAATTIAEAIQAIRGEGKFPVSVKPVESARADAGSRGGIRISRNDVIQFSTQLSIMIDTGVNLTEALECIARQSDKPPVKALVSDLAEQLQSGIALSEAMARHPRSFPMLYIALIRASEKSGMMPKLLMRATGYLKDEQETLRRVKGALTYPGIMFGFALTTTIFLLTFVLPRFTVIYANKQAALPMPTQVLMSASQFLIGNWIALIIGVVVAVVLFMVLKRTDTGRTVFHYIKLNVPLLGSMFRKLYLTRGLRMVGTLAGAGVPLMDCICTAENLCDNVFFRGLWASAREQIQAGRQLSDPLFGSNLVPRSVAQMISSGEKSGRLAQVMEQIASYAEQELKDQIAALTRYIEPAMIVVMGLIIGGVALALLLPIFTISRVMAH